ncbi:hypothetical protein PybrP1_004862 [[Pythium] brassicae (nom. inval.)]|nr:hypothetical protein PybrP1_004862 [[Pythium] brassicae (nom. inval.)]
MLYGFIKNMPKAQAMSVTIGGTIGLSYVCWAYYRYTGPDFGGALPGEPRTTSAEWQAASVEYSKVQKANPIRHFKQQ